MRVIAGIARGRRLLSPPGDRVRPTQERVREALFNILAEDVADARFLDLFAGSGANGIEALSRGAAEAAFVDDHAQSLACIRKNLENTRLDDRGQCLRLSLPRDLTRVSGAFDLVFADPPYDFAAYEVLLAQLAESGLVRDGGRVIVEHPRRTSLPDVAGTLRVARRRDYGSTTLSFYA